MRNGLLAECLTAWAAGEDSIEASAGATRVAEVLNLLRAVLTAKK